MEPRDRRSRCRPKRSWVDGSAPIRRLACGLLIAVGLLAGCSSEDASSSSSATTDDAPGPGPAVGVGDDPVDDEPGRATTTHEPVTDPDDTPLCPTLDLERAFASVEDPGLVEISGAVAGHHSPGVVWVHQDSGHPAVVTALGPDGTTVGHWTAPGVDPWDWEDIALAVDDSGEPWLFVGDIGDNRATRSELEVIRVPEPRDPTGGGTFSVVQRLVLRSPAGPADAEALIVDPHSGDLIVLTKSIDGSADVLVAPGGAWAADGSTLDMRLAGSLRLGLFQAVLAADISADGTVVVVRTPTSVLWWDRNPDQTVARTLLDEQWCLMPSVFDPLGEAIALLPGGGYLLVGEGRHAPLHRTR